MDRLAWSGIAKSRLPTLLTETSYEAIGHVVVHLKGNSLNAGDFDLKSRTVSALLPIKLAVEALCRRNSNLTAKARINFVLQSLKEQHTSLSEYYIEKSHRSKSYRNRECLTVFT
ncbi:hypothetical protein TNCV_2870181 [Trichonephila clavipes]|nr:hypothetical protein TNCV_2870181 [Trichonephila clavipes]